MIDWLSRHDWLGHIVEALVLAVLAFLVLWISTPIQWAALAGVAFAIGHFHGREKRDYEVSVKMKPPHLDGYKIWLWSWDQLTDFIPVALFLGALYVFLEWAL